MTGMINTIYTSKFLNRLKFHSSSRLFRRLMRQDIFSCGYNNH